MTGRLVNAPRRRRPPTLTQRYAALLNADTDIKTHLPTFVDAVERRHAQTVIELGVREGNSTIAWLYALERTGGHLWSVDTDVSVQQVGEYPHWTLIQGNDEAGDVLELLPPAPDIVFIDTSHSYEHTLSELSLYVGQVRPGGCVFLHDTDLEVADAENLDDPFPVRRALDDYCAQQGRRWHNTPGSFGLGRIDL